MMTHIATGPWASHADRLSGDAVRPVIDAMAEQRRKPREISGRDLVPTHIRETYEQRWQDEDRALLAAEAARAGYFLRLWRALVGR